MVLQGSHACLIVTESYKNTFMSLSGLRHGISFAVSFKARFPLRKISIGSDRTWIFFHLVRSDPMLIFLSGNREIFLMWRHLYC